MRLKLHHQILITMILGAAIGLPLNYLAEQGSIDASWPRTVAAYGKGVGDLFLRLLSMIVVPLILTSLISGVISTGNLKGLGRLGSRTIVYYISTSLMAIIVGIVMVNLIKPGVGADLTILQETAEKEGHAVSAIDEAAHGAYRAACLYALNDRQDKAFENLERFLILSEGGEAAVERIRGDADLARLKDDPRYEQVLGRAEGIRESSKQGLGETLWKQLFTLVPSNPFASMADGSNRSILGVIFFSLLFGAFVIVVGGETADLMSRFFNGAFDVMMHMTMFIIKTAPIGVLGFMLYASAGKGYGVFIPLAWYMLTVFLALAFHALITLPLLLTLLGRRSPWAFYKAMSPALLTAFSTASSNGTLPLTLTSIEKRAGISNRISSFVLPLGATINMDGTALYEAVAVLFIAQVYDKDLSMAQQVVVAITALLASIGAAGIPHAGTVMMVIVLGAVGLPLEAVGLILAVDRILDMCRTSVNVWSDSTALCSRRPARGNVETSKRRNAEIKLQQQKHQNNDVWIQVGISGFLLGVHNLSARWRSGLGLAGFSV